MSDFTVQRTEHDEHVELRLLGEPDLASADALEQAAVPPREGGSLTLDLAELTFIDSSGLKVLMNLDRRSRQQGWTLAIVNAGGQVLRVLRLCGFDRRLSINAAGADR